MAENLVKELTDLKPSLEKAEVVVKADTETKSSEIQKIMKAAQEAEYSKLILAGEPLTKKEQKKLDENATNKPIEKQQSKPVDTNDYDWNE